jgi:hypothetical protein
LGRAGLPPVFRPIESLKRELDQPDVDGRNPGEAFYRCARSVDGNAPSDH